MDWGECYRQGETPWEKGEAHPELPYLLEEHRALFEEAGSLLIPGCGFGHDARLIATAAKGTVTGLDLAGEALEKARRFASERVIDWQLGNLFEWRGSYDLIFEHTCFCAIPVAKRPDYVGAMARLIPAGGHLVGIFFLNPDHEGEEGPPFGVGVAELEEFFGGKFEICWSQAPAKSYPGREGEGRELSLLMRRRA